MHYSKEVFCNIRDQLLTTAQGIPFSKFVNSCGMASNFEVRCHLEELIRNNKVIKKEVPDEKGIGKYLIYRWNHNEGNSFDDEV